MREYKIPTQKLNFYGLFTVTISGTVAVDYPDAHITILAQATRCKDKTYKLSLAPDRGK